MTHLQVVKNTMYTSCSDCEAGDLMNREHWDGEVLGRIIHAANPRNFLSRDIALGNSDLQGSNNRPVSLQLSDANLAATSGATHGKQVSTAHPLYSPRTIHMRFGSKL